MYTSIDLKTSPNNKHCIDMFPKIFWENLQKVNVNSKALCGTQQINQVFQSVQTQWCNEVFGPHWLWRQRAHCTDTHIHTHMHKPRETKQRLLQILVIVLTRAGLVNNPATVLALPRVAIPGKILATKAISVQRLFFTVLFYPLGRAKALGLFQQSCVSSESCHIAVGVLLHLILSFRSGACGIVQSSVPQLASLSPGQEACTA